MTNYIGEKNLVNLFYFYLKACGRIEEATAIEKEAAEIGKKCLHSYKKRNGVEFFDVYYKNRYRIIVNGRFNKRIDLTECIYENEYDDKYSKNTFTALYNNDFYPAPTTANLREYHFTENLITTNICKNTKPFVDITFNFNNNTYLAKMPSSFIQQEDNTIIHKKLGYIFEVTPNICGGFFLHCTSNRICDTYLYDVRKVDADR